MGAVRRFFFTGYADERYWIPDGYAERLVGEAEENTRIVREAMGDAGNGDDGAGPGGPAGADGDGEVAVEAGKVGGKGRGGSWRKFWI